MNIGAILLMDIDLKPSPATQYSIGHEHLMHWVNYSYQIRDKFYGRHLCLIQLENQFRNHDLYSDVWLEYVMIVWYHHGVDISSLKIYVIILTTFLVTCYTRIWYLIFSGAAMDDIFVTMTTFPLKWCSTNGPDNAWTGFNLFIRARNLCYQTWQLHSNEHETDVIALSLIHAMDIAHWNKNIVIV